MNKVLLQDLFFIILTRGSGFAITVTMLFANTIARGQQAYIQIGQDMALALLIVGAPIGVVAQIQIRRITATGDLARYLRPANLVSLGAATAAILSLLTSTDKRLGGVEIKTVLEAMGFILCQSVLVSLLLLSSLAKNTMLKVSILLMMCVSLFFILSLRWLNPYGVAKMGLIVEISILWFAGFIALRLAGQVPKLAKTPDPYPFSFQSFSKYVIAVLVFNGLIVVDWRLLKTILDPQAFTSISQPRVLIERLFMPILATTVSALLVGKYRNANNNRRNYLAHMPLPQIISICGLLSIAVGVASLHWPIGFVLLPLGYLAFGAVSYFVDLYQAQHSIEFVAITLVGYLLFYACVSWIAISNFGISGHAVAWLLSNVLFAFLMWLAIERKRVPTISAS